MYQKMTNLIDLIQREREARFERDKAIVAAREGGLSYAAIGKMFQLSGANIKDRIDRFHRKRIIAESLDPFVKLSPTTSKLLQAHGLTTIDGVVAAYHRNQLLNIHNFGRKRLREVEKWFPVTKN